MSSYPNPNLTRLLLLLVVLVAAIGAGWWIANSVINRQSSEVSKPNDRDPREVPFVTTPHNVVDKMLELCEIKSDELMLDLGCGDGRIVIAAAKKYGCRGRGFDIDPKLIEQCKVNAKEAGVEHLVEFHVQDIFELDISDADVITMYLMPFLNLRLLPQLQTLKPGSRVVSHEFELPGVKEDLKIQIKGPGEIERDRRVHTIYLWNTPMLLDPAFRPEPLDEFYREYVKIKDRVEYASE